MPIDFVPDRWEKIKADARVWWAGELDRPLIQYRLQGRSPGRAVPKLPGVSKSTTAYNPNVTPEAIVDRWDYELSSVQYLGDSFPHVWVDFGPGVLATALGATAVPKQDTVWFHPETKQEIGDLHLRYDPSSPWMQRIKAICRCAGERWQGRVQVGITDLGGTLDILSTFRPSEQLLLDLYDHPNEVKRLIWEIHDAWWQAFDDLNAVLRPPNPGYSAWTGIFSETPYYMLQCDFSYMISPAMFDEFVKPELTVSCRRLGNAFYHLDGPGQLPYLDSLLEIKELKGVQWVPGAGVPDGRHWPEVHRKVRKAGKLL